MRFPDMMLPEGTQQKIRAPFYLNNRRSAQFLFIRRILPEDLFLTGCPAEKVGKSGSDVQSSADFINSDFQKS